MLVEPLLQQDSRGGAVDACADLLGSRPSSSQQSLCLNSRQALVEKLHFDLGRVGEPLAEADGPFGGDALLAAHG